MLKLYIMEKKIVNMYMCHSAKEKGFTIKINQKVYIRKGGYKE